MNRHQLGVITVLLCGSVLGASYSIASLAEPSESTYPESTSESTTYPENTERPTEQPEKTPPFRPQFAALGAGSVDWHRALSLLVKMNFDGPLCVHTEYEFDETIIRQVGYADTKPPGLAEVAQKDVAFLRGILAETAA